MARRATWIVILALIVMPLLGSGTGRPVFAQDNGDQTAETVDVLTTADDETTEGETAEDGEIPTDETDTGEEETVEPTQTETPTPTETTAPTEEPTATDAPTEAPTEVVEPSVTPDETTPATEPTVDATETTAPAATATKTPKPTKTPEIEAADVKTKTPTKTPVTTKSQIVITLNCTGTPERIRVANTGPAAITVNSIGSIYQANGWEPVTVNKKIWDGNSYEWLTGPLAPSGNTRLTNNYIFTNSAYEDEGVVLNTSIGTITKRCPSVPPTKLSDIKVTINCNSDPEKIRVTNNGSQAIEVYTIGSLYNPWTAEPYKVNTKISADHTRSWSAGPGATGSYVLSRNFMFTNSAYDKDGVKVVTSSGTITVRCPARPADPFGGAKWIEVNLSSQYLIAWQNGVRVNETYVSTGRPGFDTPTGTWYINSKIYVQDMSGCIQGECYYVPDVPWVMYFTDWGHALHGAYWHNNFGNVMSHGCVNLPVSFAEWLFNWTPYGTAVVVHY